MTEALIVRNDTGLTVAFTPSAEALKSEALESSALIGKVTNAPEQVAAVEAQSKLDSLVKQVEKARKLVKEPIIEYGRAIDTAAKRFVDEANAELYRVSKLIADFQTLELARQRAAEQAARKELEEAERKRQAELAQARSHEEREAIQERQNDEAQAAAPVIPQPIRVEGQRISEVWEFEVTNPYDLAKFHPHCVRIEPLNGEIKRLLDQGVTVRGISNPRKVVQAGIRQSRRAIDV